MYIFETNFSLQKPSNWEWPFNISISFHLHHAFLSLYNGLSTSLGVHSVQIWEHLCSLKLFFCKSKVGKLFFLQFSCYELQTYLYYIYRVYKPNSHFFAETTKVATFQTIYCQEWSFMPTTQKLWLKRGQLTTWKRNENARTCSMSSCQSKGLFLIF